MKYEPAYCIFTGFIHFFLRYFAHFFNPPFPPQPRVAVFVMDVSGSMSGDKIIQSKEALIETLDILNDDVRFDTHQFLYTIEN